MSYVIPEDERAERKRMIDEALRAGFTYAEIGRSLGYCRERIRQIVAMEGIELSHLAWPVCRERMARVAAERNARSEERRAKREARYQPVADAVLAGESITSAALRHGVPPQSALTYLKTHGVRSRHKSRNPRYR